MRRPALALTGAALLIVGFAPLASEALGPRIARLQSMPSEQRRELAARLDRFDALAPAERASIRELDRRLESQPEEERLRMLARMRAYANWAEAQPEEVRAELAAAAPARRLEIVQERRAAAPAPGWEPTVSPALWVHSPVYNPIPLHEAAYLLRVWYGLDEAARRSVEQLPTPEAQQARLAGLGREAGIAWDAESLQRFRRELDELGNRPAQRPLAQVLRQIDAEDLLAGRVGPPRAADAAVRKMREEAGRFRGRILRNLEEQYIRRRSGRVEAIPPARLAEFERRLPDWYRRTLDLLPPEAARDRVIRLHGFLAQDEELLRRIESSEAPAGPTAPPNGGSAPKPAPGESTPLPF